MRNTDELLTGLFALARHELLQNDPDWPNTTLPENACALLVFERLGLVRLVLGDGGKFTWTATDALIHLAEHSGVRLPEEVAQAGK